MGNACLGEKTPNQVNKSEPLTIRHNKQDITLPHSGTKSEEVKTKYAKEKTDFYDNDDLPFTIPLTSSRYRA